jgi:hypothetical protein
VTTTSPTALAARLLDRAARERWLAYALLVGSGIITVAVLLPHPAVSASGRTFAMMVATGMLAADLGLAWQRHRIDLPPALDWRVVMAASAILLVVAMTGPVRGSRDLWSYAMYGRMVTVHHASPYTHVPADFPHDPFLGRVDPVWRHTGSVYGPLFVAYAAAVSRVAGMSTLVTELCFKGLAALSVFGALVVLARRRVDPAAMAVLGMHPLVIVYAVGGGHNDATVGLGILAGVLLCRSRRAGWAGLVLGLAALVKVVAVLAVLALAIWLWCRHERADRRLLVRLLVGTAATVVIGYAAAGGISAFGPLDSASHQSNWASFWHPVSRVLHGTSLAPATSILAIALVLALAALLMYRHRRDHGPEVIVMGALLAYQLCSAYVLIWYLLWVLPLALMRWRTLTCQALLAYATVLLFATSYHPDPRERLDRVLFAHGTVLHLFALASMIALGTAALVYRPRAGRPAPLPAADP